MDRLHRGVLETPAGRFAQVSELSHRQRQYLKALQVPVPTRYEAIEAILIEFSGPTP